MLTAQQTDTLELDEPQPGQATVNGVVSPGCTWFGRVVDYNVQFIPIDAELAVTAPGAVVELVNGFGAVRNLPPPNGGPPICQVTIDVAVEQTIRVQASTLPGRPDIDDDQLCRRATDVASMVMTTVVEAASR